MKTVRKRKAFPDEVTLKRIREKLSDPNYRGGNLALPRNATEVDRAKYQLCQIMYHRQSRWYERCEPLKAVGNPTAT